MIVEGWLHRAARTRPAGTALEGPEGACTYAELHAAARSGARALAERGVTPGDRVALALAPGLAFAEALHACLLLGAIAVPVDLRLAPAERARVCDGAVLVVDEPLSGDLTPGASSAGTSSKGTPASAASSSSSSSSSSSVSAAIASGHDLGAVAAVIHTSGTTSAPRPIELTYGNFLWSALGSAVALDRDPRERWLCALPVSHVGGLSILVRSAIYATTAVVHERFDTERVLRAIAREEITLVSLVATTLTRLLDAGLSRPPALRCALTGGGPVPEALIARARAAGVPVGLTYGLTEACSQVTTSAPGGAPGKARGVEPDRGLEIVQKKEGLRARAYDGFESTVARAGSARVAHESSPGGSHAGPPLFCTRVRIAGAPPGVARERGSEPAAGEILVSGPTVAPGARDPDGWLHTGDLGSLDEHGCLHITGRVADTIVSGGENVAPAEVEAALESHPGVLEAAVLGRPDPEWGEVVAAIVVPRPGSIVESGTLRAHCAARLARYKVPKQLDFTGGPLPRTPSGKLLRRELT